jgi:hypothetical protein
MANSVVEPIQKPFGDFPEEEENIIQFWRETNAFQRSFAISVDEGRPPYVFYDGPPFATVLSPWICIQWLTFSGSAALRTYSCLDH